MILSFIVECLRDVSENLDELAKTEVNHDPATGVIYTDRSSPRSVGDPREPIGVRRVFKIDLSEVSHDLPTDGAERFQILLDRCSETLEAALGTESKEIVEAFRIFVIPYLEKLTGYCD